MWSTTQQACCAEIDLVIFMAFSITCAIRCWHSTSSTSMSSATDALPVYAARGRKSVATLKGDYDFREWEIFDRADYPKLFLRGTPLRG